MPSQNGSTKPSKALYHTALYRPTPLFNFPFYEKPTGIGYRGQICRVPRGYLSYPWKLPAGIPVAPGYPPNIGHYPNSIPTIPPQYDKLTKPKQRFYFNMPKSASSPPLGFVDKRMICSSPCPLRALLGNSNCSCVQFVHAVKKSTFTF